MYPYQPQTAEPDETVQDLRGVMPEQRPPLDAAMLDEPTSEVPVIRSTNAADPGTDIGDGTVTDPATTDPAIADPAVDRPAPEDGTEDATQADGYAAATETETTEHTVETTQSTDTIDPTSPFGPDQPDADDAPLDPESADLTGSDVPPAPRRDEEQPVALWTDSDAERLRDQWRELQGQFIDDPAVAVSGAKTLITEAVQDLAGTLLTAQDELDPYRAGEPDTESLRMAMRRYREFLDRVLAL